MTDNASHVTQSIPLSIAQGLESAGNTRSFAGVIPLYELCVGGHCLSIAAGVSYDVAVTNTGEGLLLSGIARMSAITSCDRCLNDTQLDVSAEVSCYYLQTPIDDEADDADWDIGQIDEVNGVIDIYDAVLGAIVSELPFVILCKEDCAGLCPVCGTNLNEGSCNCADASDIDPLNPFAALRDITLTHS